MDFIIKVLMTFIVFGALIALVNWFYYFMVLTTAGNILSLMIIPVIIYALINLIFRKGSKKS